LTKDKLTTAVLFPTHTIPTELLSQWKMRENDKNQQFIIKERGGYGGKGIQTHSGAELQQNLASFIAPTKYIVQPLMISKALIAAKSYENFDLHFVKSLEYCKVEQIAKWCGSQTFKSYFALSLCYTEKKNR
jgi:hypothetical protein